MADQVSTRFPFINLVKALERAAELYADDKRGNGLKMPTAFMSWGYSDKSSGGFQTVAALKGYGLLMDDGSKAERSVKLTEAARRYFMTEIEDDRDVLRRSFALRPGLFNHLHDRWESEIPSDAVARSYLKTEVGLNEQSARAALGIYRSNLAFVSPKGSGKAADEPEDFTPSSEVTEEPPVQQGQSMPQPVGAPPAAAIPAATLSMAAAGPTITMGRMVDGYVILLGGVVATKEHADEVIGMLTQLKGMLPDGPKPSSDTSN